MQTHPCSATVCALRRIGICLGDLHDLEGGGLGEFAMQIGQRLAAHAPAWRVHHGIVFDFHLRPHLIGRFGPDVGYLPVSHWRRLWHTQAQPYAIWHGLHQINKNLPPRQTAHRLVTVHDLNYLYGNSALSVWRHERRMKTLLRRTDGIVAISHHTAADIKQHLGWTRDITVIHNGARSFTTTAQEPLPGWTAQGALQGAPQDQRPFLFHLSRMSPSKNPQAIVALARTWPEMLFVLCGPPSDDAKKLRETVRLPNVEFHLGISDAQKAWAYAHCTGFLFPSLTEGFGLPPIEAMHFGKPVFLARRTCLPEIGGDAAAYFDHFDPQHMKVVVQLGLARHAEPGRVEAVRQHAAQFDWDRAAAAYLALYRRLLRLPAV